MDRNKDLEKFLGEIMAVEKAGMESPNPALVYSAREKIMARKKPTKASYNLLDPLVSFFRLNFKFYHVGFSLILIMVGVFYLNEPNYNSNNSAGFIEYHDALSITNTTISVNSSTMLTSIPTMVIRN